MPITVKLHGRVRMTAKSDEIEISETVKTVGDLIEKLACRLGPEFERCVFDQGTRELSQSLIMLVNGHSVRMLEGLKTQLNERDTVIVDTVEIMEIVGGG